ncbi:MAG: LacI family DNA-binding transcriptional regulator [Anaerolineae bacterium]|nr:LacI family DNA-binding transcriptional regulator [Anaerolineae bacterium]
MSVTIKDIAAELGISVSAVSKALNNYPDVASETKRQVKETAQRLGYRANITARNLRASETRLFGYSWQPNFPDQFDPILDRFLQAMAEAAARHGYHLLTFPNSSVDAELDTYAEMVRTGQVDGFVLSNTNLDDRRVHRLLENEFPFVAFGRSNVDWDFPWVDVDGTAGVRIAIQHLIAQGHRRIACLAWPEASLTGQFRLQGYLESMEEAGLPVEPEWIERRENVYADAYAAALRLLALPAAHRPSAIIALTDLMAMGVLNAAWDAGLEPGRDLAVVGFDDAPMARFLRPPLTSLRQPIAEVGERLVTMLVNLVKGQLSAKPHILLQPELIVRASSIVPCSE